jgi:radical SAM superfamily enzyme YgiQ (UPF0313 family)
VRILIGYPRLENANAPAIGVGILNTILKGNDVRLFDSAEYVSNNDSGILKKGKLGGGQVVDLGVTTKPRSQFIPDWVEFVKFFSPELILMSCTEDTIGLGREMLRSIENFNIPNVVGGAFAKSARELCLSYPEVQSVSVTDADINITPDYSLYKREQFLRPLSGKAVVSVPIETMRGCPYTCSFCCSASSRELNTKDPAVLEEELERHIEQLNPDWFFINDDCFLARPLDDLAELMEVFAKFDVPWWCNTRFEDITKEKIDLLKHGGVGRIQFGLEHGNETFRKNVLNRKVSNSKILRSAGILNASNIPYGINVMLGFPTETRELVFDTIKMLKQIRGYDGVSVSVMVPYHGTPIREMAVTLGLISDDYISDSGFLGEPALNQNAPYLTNDEILEMSQLFKHYAFFDESLWDDITLETLDFWEDKYNEQFYSHLPLGGEQHITRRGRYEISK